MAVTRPLMGSDLMLSTNYHAAIDVKHVMNRSQDNTAQSMHEMGREDKRQSRQDQTGIKKLKRQPYPPKLLSISHAVLSFLRETLNREKFSRQRV